jgi:hypothetical protein
VYVCACVRAATLTNLEHKIWEAKNFVILEYLLKILQNLIFETFRYRFSLILKPTDDLNKFQEKTPKWDSSNAIYKHTDNGHLKNLN